VPQLNHRQEMDLYALAYQSGNIKLICLPYGPEKLVSESNFSGFWVSTDLGKLEKSGKFLFREKLGKFVKVDQMLGNFPRSNIKIIDRCLSEI